MARKSLSIGVALLVTFAPLLAEAAGPSSHAANVGTARGIVERMREATVLREQGVATWLLGRDGLAAGASVATSELAPFLCVGEMASAMTSGALLVARGDAAQSDAIAAAQELARRAGADEATRALDDAAVDSPRIAAE